MTEKLQRISATMERIYEMAGRLPSVIPQKLARECWDETWKEYVEDTLAGSEVQIGSGLTIFRGAKSRNIGDIAHEALHRKVDI